MQFTVQHTFEAADAATQETRRDAGKVNCFLVEIEPRNIYRSFFGNTGKLFLFAREKEIVCSQLEEIKNVQINGKGTHS